MTAVPSPAPLLLIVDDEPDNRDLLEVLLGCEGYRVETASCGDEALAMLAAGSAPDLILLDVMMPYMDGYQVTAKVKADPATSAIPILIVSALDERKVRPLALDAGADDVMTKPLDRAVLYQRVRALLGDTPTSNVV